MDSHGGTWEPETAHHLLFLVPTLQRGNAYRSDRSSQGMGSHGGPWEPEKKHWNLEPEKH